MQLRKINTYNKPEVKSIGSLQVLFLNHHRFLPNLGDYNFDAIVLENDSLLGHIRKDNTLYLKPTFIHKEVTKITDGIFDVNNPHAIINKVEKINQSIELYDQLSLPDEPQEQIIVKLLRYLISRSISLDPIPTRFSNIGFSYSLLEDLSIESDRIFLIKAMNQYVDQNYFKKIIVDKINLCYKCEGSYLNFTECCTSCNSVDLKTENLIHHFRCAYIGPESDFLKDEHLSCPKCDHLLKHIGIDYDKPSEIHKCKNCNHTSQETKMKAKCIDCSKENELDQLSTHSIFKYLPTEKGRQIALSENNAPSLKHEAKIKESNFTVPLGAFLLLKNHELKKGDSYKNKIYQFTLNLNKSITKNLSPTFQINLLEELCGIIKPYLKKHDLITINEENNIATLLIDYSEDLVKETAEIISYNLDKMLKDNGWTKEQALSFDIQNLTK